eukprot:420226_1
MPYSMDYDYYRILNGFDNILLVFYFIKNQVFILDLLNMKWHKSKCAIPNDFADVEECYIMKMNENMHIIDFDNGINCKVNIHDIIPGEITLSRRKYFKPLVTGYIVEKQNELLLQLIPLDVQMIILNYFPLFL